MDNNESFFAILIRVIRWITRIVSLLVVILVIALFLGEEVFSNEKKDGINISFMAAISGIMMIGGLLAAWKWEIWGGLISLVGFAWIVWFNPDGRSMPIMYLVFGLPAVLFVICGLVQKFYVKNEHDSQSD
jgi:hypothetical protein